MAQESKIYKKKIAIIGGGPAGAMCAITAAQSTENEISIFDKGIILNTILPTGGGRCNLAYAEYEFRELAKFYPRGEKFLYSILSRFSTAETIEFFQKAGVETYTQDDNRIFPKSNSAKDVKEAFLKLLNKKNNIKKIFENVIEVKKMGEKFLLKTNKGNHEFDVIVIASGGRSNGQSLAKKLGHNITELRPALCGLITIEKDFAEISGISVKNLCAEVFFENKKQKTLTGDLLFTHKGISGPLVYKISSYCTYLNFNKNNPLKIKINLINKSFEDFDEEFLNMLNKYPQKEALSVFSLFLPKNLACAIFEKIGADPKTKAGQLKKSIRQELSKTATGLELNATEMVKGEEIVTAGGVDLKEVNAKTMESKIVPNLYFCGEVLDIDGLTGGFNLQNCWSTGFVAGKALVPDF